MPLADAAPDRWMSAKKQERQNRLSVEGVRRSRVKGAGDVPALVSCEVGRRADPGSDPVCLSGVRTCDADPLQQSSGDRVAAGLGASAPEDPALRGSQLWALSSGVAAGGGSRPGAAAA